MIINHGGVDYWIRLGGAMVDLSGCLTAAGVRLPDAMAEDLRVLEACDPALLEALDDWLADDEIGSETVH